MTNPANPGRFADRLLRQDTALQTPQYQEHRMELERQLIRAERNEKRVYWIVVGALILSVAAFIPTATKTFGGADPGDDDATILSVTVGLIYILAAIVFWVGLASYHSRFRVATKDVKERLIFESIRELRQDVHELRQLVAPKPPSAS